jgi:hypothetical protein
MAVCGPVRDELFPWGSLCLFIPVRGNCLTLNAYEDKWFEERRSLCRFGKDRDGWMSFAEQSSLVIVFFFLLSIV